VKKARDDFPIASYNNDTFLKKEDVKAVSGKVQVPPLLRHSHNAILEQFEFETLDLL